MSLESSMLSDDSRLARFVIYRTTLNLGDMSRQPLLMTCSFMTYLASHLRPLHGTDIDLNIAEIYYQDMALYEQIEPRKFIREKFWVICIL